MWSIADGAAATAAAASRCVDAITMFFVSEKSSRMASKRSTTERIELGHCRMTTSNGPTASTDTSSTYTVSVVTREDAATLSSAANSKTLSSIVANVDPAVMPRSPRTKALHAPSAWMAFSSAYAARDSLRR
jgi:hypothetical protein